MGFAVDGVDFLDHVRRVTKLPEVMAHVSHGMMQMAFLVKNSNRTGSSKLTQFHASNTQETKLLNSYKLHFLERHAQTCHSNTCTVSNSHEQCLQPSHTETWLEDVDPFLDSRGSSLQCFLVPRCQRDFHAVCLRIVCLGIRADGYTRMLLCHLTESLCTHDISISSRSASCTLQ